MPGETKFEKLFSPFQLGQMKLKNRILMSSMSVGFVTEDGYITDRFVDYFEERAKGGVGLIMVGYANVDFPRGNTGLLRISVDDDKYIPGLRRIVEVVKRHGAKVALQLNHAGGFARRSQTGFESIAPSPVICRPRGDLPREMTLAEIRDMVDRFAKGAERAVRAGFDGVEVHATGPYLISEFLSPFTNRRRDAYGGNLENRGQFLLEVVSAIKATVGPDYPVWVKITAVQFGVRGGITLEDTKQVAKMLEDAGCCAINVNIYDRVWPLSPMAEPFGSNIDFAAAIKKVVDIPVIAMGRITPQVAERALQEGKADLVVIGRGLLADPELPFKAATGRLEDIRLCIGCDSCKTVSTEAARCTVNASLGKERKYKIMPAERTKKVIVVGGGPAGLEAATAAALRGHHVTLYEKNSSLGGRLNTACKMPGQKSIEELIKYLSNQARKSGVKIELRKKVTSALINEIKPDAVILATGARVSWLSRFVALMATVLAGGKIRQKGGRGFMLRTREGKREVMGVQSIVLMSAQPNDALYRELGSKVPEIYHAGDCVDPFGIMEAIADGARVGRLV